MTDKYYEWFEGPIDAPAFRAYAATKDDDNDLPFTSRAVYCGGGGSLVVYMEGNSTDTAITFSNVPQGSWLPIRAKRILESSSATDIIVMY